MLQTSSSASLPSNAPFFFSFSLFSCTFERLKFLPSSRWDGIHFRPTLTFITAACCTFSRHSGHSGEWRRKASEILRLPSEKSWWHCSARRAYGARREAARQASEGGGNTNFGRFFICALNNKMVHLNRPFLKASRSFCNQATCRKLYLISFPRVRFYFCC